MLQLRGEDHAEYGTYTCRVIDDRTACTLSVGADSESPSLEFKGQRDVPNEDALLAVDPGPFCVVAVADAHRGPEASHRLLDLLAAELAGRPLLPAQLARAVGDLYDEEGDPASESAAAFLVALYHRELREGFGISFGDCTFTIVGEGRIARPLNEQTPNFVNAARPESLDPEYGRSFHFSAGPGDLLLAFTDGIDECCYRRPQASIRPQHLAGIRAEAGSDPEPYARALTELALAGVDGHPGGQDNVALIVSRA